MTQYYCISCGHKYDQRLQDCQGIIPDILLLTCTNKTCKAFMQTTSPNNIYEFANAHKIAIKFNCKTGKRIK